MIKQKTLEIYYFVLYKLSIIQLDTFGAILGKQVLRSEIISQARKDWKDYLLISFTFKKTRHGKKTADFTILGKKIND